MIDYAKPLPEVSKWSKPFWEGAKAHKLLLKKCKKCGHIDHPPYPFCTECMHEEAEWVEASGKGKIYTLTTTFLGAPPPFADEVPYTVGMVNLVEGPRIFTRFVPSKPKDLAIGTDVEVVYDDINEEITLVRFRPV